MTKQLTLMAVHAHPDDESLYMGGVLAHYSDERVNTILVTCTRGDLGQISSPELNTEENGRQLGGLRDAELRQAIRVLGVRKFYQLGYRDSGLLGAASNDHPRSFHKADMGEAIGRLVRLVRRERPDILISYDESGDYGHPDHIKAHQITVAASQAAADAAAFPEAGDPWNICKLYYSYIRPSLWLRAMEKLRERGMKTDLDEPGFNRDRYRDDPRARTVIPVTDFLKRKIEALQCHRTQANVYLPILTMPESFLRDFAGYESFILAESCVGFPDQGKIETDLFAGLR